MMGSTYVDVDDAYIDRLKDDIRIAVSFEANQEKPVIVLGSNLPSILHQKVHVFEEDMFSPHITNVLYHQRCLGSMGT